MRYICMLSRIEKYGPLNSHDLIKVIALIIMTIDHIGAYLLPEDLWWRAVGRITFPVWFFLVGYARGGRIGQELWWGAWLLLLAQMATYNPLLPLNALVSIIVCRLCLRAAERFNVIARFPLECLVALFLLHVVLNLFWEYGAVAIMFACAGRMVRMQLMGGKYLAFWAGAVATFLLWQEITFAFDLLQMAFVIVGTVLVCMWLYRFEQKPLAWTLPAAVDWSVKLVSRYSLQYYVLHRIVFQIIGAYVLYTHALVPKIF